MDRRVRLYVVYSLETELGADPLRFISINELSKVDLKFPIIADPTREVSFRRRPILIIYCLSFAMNGILGRCFVRYAR